MTAVELSELELLAGLLVAELLRCGLSVPSDVATALLADHVVHHAVRSGTSTRAVVESFDDAHVRRFAAWLVESFGALDAVEDERFAGLVFTSSAVDRVVAVLSAGAVEFDAVGGDVPGVVSDALVLVGSAPAWSSGWLGGAACVRVVSALRVVAAGAGAPAGDAQVLSDCLERALFDSADGVVRKLI